MDYYYIFEIQNGSLWKFHCKRASWEDATKYITNWIRINSIVERKRKLKWKIIRGIGYDIGESSLWGEQE